MTKMDQWKYKAYLNTLKTKEDNERFNALSLNEQYAEIEEFWKPFSRTN